MGRKDPKGRKVSKHRMATTQEEEERPLEGRGEEDPAQDRQRAAGETAGG